MQKYSAHTVRFKGRVSPRNIFMIMIVACTHLATPTPVYPHPCNLSFCHLYRLGRAVGIREKNALLFCFVAVRVAAVSFFSAIRTIFCFLILLPSALCDSHGFVSLLPFRWPRGWVPRSCRKRWPRSTLLSAWQRAGRPWAITCTTCTTPMPWRTRFA